MINTKVVEFWGATPISHVAKHIDDPHWIICVAPFKLLVKVAYYGDVINQSAYLQALFLAYAPELRNHKFDKNFEGNRMDFESFPLLLNEFVYDHEDEEWQAAWSHAEPGLISIDWELGFDDN